MANGAPHRRLNTQGGNTALRAAAAGAAVVASDPGPCGGPAGYCAYYKQAFGPVAATYAALTPPDRAAALDRDFLAFAAGHNTGPPDGPAELHYQYLRVIARTRH